MPEVKVYYKKELISGQFGDCPVYSKGLIYISAMFIYMY
jgi:hypothetical protein